MSFCIMWNASVHEKPVQGFLEKRPGLRKLVPVLAALAALGTGSAAWALPSVGARLLVENTGEVSATFLGGTASYTSLLYLDQPDHGLGSIFNNQTTSAGWSVSLGTF